MYRAGLLIVIMFLALNHLFDEEVTHNDPMNQVVFSIGDVQFSWWPISHVVLHAILGFAYPHCFWQIMTLGIIWELVEFVAGIVFTHRRNKVTSDGDVQYNKQWWAPNLYDPLFNLAGNVIGYTVRKHTIGLTGCLGPCRES